MPGLAHLVTDLCSAGFFEVLDSLLVMMGILWQWVRSAARFPRSGKMTLISEGPLFGFCCVDACNRVTSLGHLGKANNNDLFLGIPQRAAQTMATPPPSRVVSRVRVVATTLPSLLLALVLLTLAAVPQCNAVSPGKNAEDKLREQGLLHDDDPTLDTDTPDGDTTLRSGEDGKGKHASSSPAEGMYQEAKKLLSDFDARSRRKSKAFGLLQQAIELDGKHRGALLLMGRAYQTGEGVDVDEARAVDYFDKAAALGDPGAHEELGFVYSVGWVRGMATLILTTLPKERKTTK